MTSAARMSPVELTSLIQRMPEYGRYRTRRDAALGERTFRQALGKLLKACGDHLLAIAENHAHLLSDEQEGTIDELVDVIGSIFRRLDREGHVVLVGELDATIAELQELDVRLILLVEQAMRLTRHLAEDLPEAVWFLREAPRLLHDLTDFSQTTEERNYLLGLGWESEFTWPQRN
jgi:hypothetical protein